MNKEYMYLNNQEMLVIDENGHATKRSVEIENMHDLLLLENNLEEINSWISGLEKYLKQYEEVKKFTRSQKMVLSIFAFIIYMSVYGYAHWVLSINNITCILGLALSTLMCYSGYRAIAKERIKNINAAKRGLSQAYELKEEFERKTSNIKAQNKETIINNSLEFKEKNTGLTQTGQVVTLGDNPLLEETTRQIQESYILGYNQQEVKKRVLIKK